MKTFGQIVLLAALYALLARAGLLLADQHDNVTLIWPPTGLALAALLLYGRKLWPGVLAGVLGTSLSLGTPLPVALAFTLGNTLEAVVGASLLLAIPGFRPTLDRVQDVAAYFFVGALGCTVIAATIGATALWLAGAAAGHEAWRLWVDWWFGDVGGAVVVGPALLLAKNGRPRWRELLRRVEYAGLVVACVAIGGLAFSGVLEGPWPLVAAFAQFPLTVWAGTRLGSRGAVTASFVSVTIAVVVGGARDTGPLIVGTAHENLLLLAGYAIVLGSTSLVLAAAIAQRDRSEERYREQEQARQRAEQERSVMGERQRLVRDMHDGLGGQLISTLAMVERGRATQKELAASLRFALDDMRMVIDSLDPTSRDVWADLGRLRSRLAPQLKRTGAHLSWDVSATPALEGLHPEGRLHLIRIIQEAVTNAVRHGKARSITLRIAPDREQPDFAQLSIHDDGLGIPGDGARQGRGLANMRARADALGARLDVDSSAQGTRVVLALRAPGG